MMMSLRKSLSELPRQPGAEIPDLIRPLLEFLVVGHASLQSDRFVLRAARRFAARLGISAFAMFDHFGRPLECADLADSGDVLAVPLDAEFEVFVGIEPLRLTLN